MVNASDSYLLGRYRARLDPQQFAGPFCVTLALLDVAIISMYVDAYDKIFDLNDFAAFSVGPDR